ncbi:hypothetical protein A3K73_06325 [Candidatus Pacearchaeota archaeon RBG_13_36_9]|nr:MAG: hypothetical protein A3K73_06325 [Candidatus Pacearchaeota archaeon RBG_13_36_9]
MIGLDTTAIIDIFKEDSSIKQLMQEINESFSLTQISYLELMFGLNFDSPKHLVEKNYYDVLFRSFTNFGLSKESCARAGKILWDLKKEGKKIDEFDGVIAGILLSNGINKIITRNAKHFENIKGLKVISY